MSRVGGISDVPASFCSVFRSFAVSEKMVLKKIFYEIRAPFYILMTNMDICSTEYTVLWFEEASTCL